MAKAGNATEVQTTVPMLTLIDYDRDSIDEVMRTIRHSLAHGSAVMVLGWEPSEPVEFNLADIAAYRPPADQEVTWQGRSCPNTFLRLCKLNRLSDAAQRQTQFKRKPQNRMYTDYLVRGVLSDFVQSATDGKACYNCLDMPVFVPEMPPFVR